MALSPLSGTDSPTYPEFQHQTSSETAFALLSLNGTSRIRGFHFPTELYSRLVTCIRGTWPEGMEWATLQSDDGWDCLLQGTPWKKKGSEEVESIRLILALFETLSKEGWNLVQDVHVGSAKKDVHNFVFRNDGFQDVRDKFFAVTFPVANRISLVDPSSSCTPALISSIRSAILQPDQSSDVLQSPNAIRTDHTSPKLGFGGISKALCSNATNATGHEAYGIRGKGGESANASATSQLLKIKEEGWVATGVYGFELSGYSVFAGRGTSNFKYDSHYPSVLLALISNLNQQQSYLVTSVRLTPIKLRRDVLIFTDPARQHGLDTLSDLVLPPRLSFPSGPPELDSPNAIRSRRSIRVRPSSLASVNGGPLLPSIPASPSWEEEDGRLPTGIHQRVPDTAGPRLESSGVPYTGPFALPHRKHKKSTSMPGNAISGWRTTAHPHQPEFGFLGDTEVLRDSLDRPHEQPDGYLFQQHLSSGSPSKPYVNFVSNGNIKVKEVPSSHVAYGTGYVLASAAVRDSEVPTRGTMPLERSADSGSSTESGNVTATSSLKKQPRPEAHPVVDQKTVRKRRGGVRSVLKSLL